MQVHCFHNTKRLLITMMIFGAVAMNTPLVVQAGSEVQKENLSHETTEENIGCEKQGCTQEHNGCQKHCFREQKDQTAIVISIPDQQNTIVASLEHLSRVQYPVQKTIFVATPKRAPPTQKLLRSIMKRE